LVICSASFKKSPKIDSFSQLFEKNHTYELTPIVYGKKYNVLRVLLCHSQKIVIQKEKLKKKFTLKPCGIFLISVVL
jgi:hypothetical protein